MPALFFVRISVMIQCYCRWRVKKRFCVVVTSHLNSPDEKFANGFEALSPSGFDMSSPCSETSENMSKLLLSFIFLKLTASIAFEGSGVMGGVICRNNAKLTGLKNAWDFMSDAPARDPKRRFSSLCSNRWIRFLQFFETFWTGYTGW